MTIPTKEQIKAFTKALDTEQIICSHLPDDPSITKCDTCGFELKEGSL